MTSLLNYRASGLVHRPIPDLRWQISTAQMSRAPQRHDRTGRLARRLHLDVSQFESSFNSFPQRASGVLPKCALVGGPLTQLLSHAESTVMNTSASSEAHAWWRILAGM